jgi:hypothetical protein
MKRLLGGLLFAVGLLAGCFRCQAKEEKVLVIPV